MSTRASSETHGVRPASVALKRTSRAYHRRSQTIVAAGNLELLQLQKLMQMEVLQHDLESKSKELEESQEEAHLAALIGRSLLQRTEEMGAEIESTSMELLGRAESAELEVKILEGKLSKAYAHIRSMEFAKAKTVDDSDEMTQELETLRVRMQALKGEVAKAHDETQRVRATKELVEEELEVEKNALAKLQIAHSRVLADFMALGKRVDELEATERYNLEHIARLEIENQSICLQNRMQERRENKLVTENEAMTSKLAVQRQSLRDGEVERLQLSKSIEALNAELDDVRDAFVAEQLRVLHLTKLTKELQDRADEECKPEEEASRAVSSVGSPASSAKLRHGSLFFELSMQLKEEMRQSQQHQGAQSSPPASHRESEANQEHSEKSSPSAETARAKPSSHADPIVGAAGGEDDNNDSSSSEWSRVRRSPPSLAPASPSQRPSSPPLRSQDEEDILKEFFMLTAAAVKIAGGGLGNGTCNILNEDLYEEALNEGLTFDQYHKWLERRLEGEPESTDAAEKMRAVSSSSLARSGRDALRMAF